MLETAALEEVRLVEVEWKALYEDAMEKVAAASPHTPFSPYVAPRFPHMSEINSLFAMEKTALLQEDCEAAGLDLLEMQRHFLKTSLAGGDGPLSETLPLGEAEADGAARCAKCHVRAAITQPWGDGGGGGGGGGGEPMSDGPPPRRLCSVCSAEAALDAREPRRRHGQMEPKGASGFIGWTKGLRRTQDPTALRKMYQADRPDQIEKLEALARTVGRLTRPTETSAAHGRLLLVHKSRHGGLDVAIPAAFAEHAGLQMVEVPFDDHHPEYRSPSIRVFVGTAVHGT